MYVTTYTWPRFSRVVATSTDVSKEKGGPCTEAGPRVRLCLNRKHNCLAVLGWSCVTPFTSSPLRRYTESSFDSRGKIKQKTPIVSESISFCVPPIVYLLKVLQLPSSSAFCCFCLYRLCLLLIPSNRYNS